MARTACPECGTKYDVPDAAVGGPMVCKECDQTFEVRPIRVARAKPAPGPRPTILFAPESQTQAVSGGDRGVKPHPRIPVPNGIPRWKWVTGLTAAAATVFIILPSIALSLMRVAADKPAADLGPNGGAGTWEWEGRKEPEVPQKQQSAPAAAKWPTGTTLRVAANEDGFVYSPRDTAAYREFVKKLEDGDGAGAAFLVFKGRVLGVDSGTRVAVVHATEGLVDATILDGKSAGLRSLFKTSYLEPLR